MNNDEAETRQEQREKKLEKKRGQIRQHGRNLARMYKEAITKRIRHLRTAKQKGQEK